jgi:hypothetical protein
MEKLFSAGLSHVSTTDFSLADTVFTSLVRASCVLAEKAVSPVLFDHLPSAFRIPQEAYQVPHSAYEAEDRNMSRFGAGQDSPNNVKRAAPMRGGLTSHRPKAHR